MEFIASEITREVDSLDSKVASASTQQNSEHTQPAPSFGGSKHGQLGMSVDQSALISCFWNS